MIGMGGAMDTAVLRFNGDQANTFGQFEYHARLLVVAIVDGSRAAAMCHRPLHVDAVAKQAYRTTTGAGLMHVPLIGTAAFFSGDAGIACNGHEHHLSIITDPWRGLMCRTKSLKFRVVVMIEPFVFARLCRPAGHAPGKRHRRIRIACGQVERGVAALKNIGQLECVGWMCGLALKHVTAPPTCWMGDQENIAMRSSKTLARLAFA